jgi:hypothetical protein
LYFTLVKVTLKRADARFQVPDSAGKLAIDMAANAEIRAELQHYMYWDPNVPQKTWWYFTFVKVTFKLLRPPKSRPARSAGLGGGSLRA